MVLTVRPALAVAAAAGDDDEPPLPDPIADAIHGYVAPHGVDEVVVTGGGARNRHLVSRLASLLEPLPVMTGSSIGIDGDAKEAVAFAALAWAWLNGVAGNIAEVTGAAGPRVLGSLTPGRMAMR